MNRFSLSSCETCSHMLLSAHGLILAILDRSVTALNSNGVQPRFSSQPPLAPHYNEINRLSSTAAQLDSRGKR